MGIPITVSSQRPTACNWNSKLATDRGPNTRTACMGHRSHSYNHLDEAKKSLLRTLKELELARGTYCTTLKSNTGSILLSATHKGDNRIMLAVIEAADVLGHALFHQQSMLAFAETTGE